MLFILRGISCSGKSTVAKNFAEDVVSSDAFRKLLGGNAVNQTFNNKVFKLVDEVMMIRMQNRLFTILDATNLKLKSFRKHIELAEMYGVDYRVVDIYIDDTAAIDRSYERRKMGGLFVPEFVIKRQFETHIESTNNIVKTAKHRFASFADSEDAARYIIEEHSIDVKNHVYDFTKDDTDVFAFGDVHGYATPLEAAIKQANNIQLGAKLFQLGDFIDRGQELERVLDLLDEHNVTTLIGNHEHNFLMEYYGHKDCNSKDRTITHETNSESIKARLVKRIKESLHYAIVRLKNNTFMLTHSGINPVLIEQGANFGVADCAGNNQPISESIPNIVQVHGHRSWEYIDINEQIKTQKYIRNIDAGYYNNGVFVGLHLNADAPIMIEMEQSKKAV